MNMSSTEPYFFSLLSLANLEYYLVLQLLQTNNLCLIVLFWDTASIHILYIALVKLNKMNESAAEEKEEQKEKSVPPSQQQQQQQQQQPLLKTLQNILHNRIIQKIGRCMSIIIEHILTTYGQR
jgi:hypothetical protein